MKSRSSPTPPVTGREVVTPETGPVRIAQVAQEAGVSPSTVSRILNGTATVSAEKAAAVEAAIVKLGFRPNPVARGLAGGRTMSIGVLTQTVSSPFYGEALLGIEDELEQAGYIPLFVSGHWSETEERKALDALLERRVDGLIVLAGRLGDEALQAYARRLPMVVVGRRVPGPSAYSLTFDNRAGSRLATRHLLGLGHTHIAFIGGDPAHEDALEREAGYRDAMAEAGLTPNPTLMVAGNFTESGGLLAVTRLLASRIPFTAIVACNDQTAIGALLGLHRHNVRVPDDVSMVGFDDVAPARFSIPPLTTVHLSVYEAGAVAARSVLALLRGDAPDAPLPPPFLTPRESTRRLAR